MHNLFFIAVFSAGRSRNLRAERSQRAAEGSRKDMKKRGIALLMVAAMMAGTLSGCSGGGSTGKAGGGAQTEAQTVAEVDPSLYEVTEPITIKWWHALEEQYSETVQKVVDDFNKSQDMITVEAEYIGSYKKLNEALVAAHAAGTDLPAITVANTPYVAEYGAGGLTEDLTPYIQASGYDLKDFGDGMISASSYNGKQVSLPFLISTQIVYYNKDMADELGVEIPEKWEDMDAFLEKTSKINADGTTAVYGTIMPGWDQWYYETFYLNQGVKIINDDQVTTDLGDEKAVEIAAKIKEWCDKGYTYWTGTADDASSIMRQHFIDGEAFSVVHTSSLYTNYLSQCNFEIGMAWLPGGETKNHRRLRAVNPIQERSGYEECGMAVYAVLMQQGSKLNMGKRNRIYSDQKVRAHNR